MYVLWLYCGAGVFRLIGCISLCPSLALLTFFNNNNNNNKVRRSSQHRRLLARDVAERNSVLTNSYSLVYILHFVSTVTPQEIAKDKEVPTAELHSSGVPAPEAVDKFTTNQTLRLQSIHWPLRRKLIWQLKQFTILPGAVQGGCWSTAHLSSIS